MKRFDSDNPNQPYILYEDNHLCVVYKPPCMVVPVEGHSKSLEGYLKSYYQKKLGKETIFLRPLHRLDKPVSGLVIFARSSKGLARLQEAQRQKKIDKYYTAILETKPKKSCGVLVDQLVHGDFKALIVERDGKLSKLRYRLVVTQKEHVQVSLYLLTGRYHQIRVQFQNIGCPILGDKKYGAKNCQEGQPISLFHTKVIFPHPIGGKKMTVKLRADFYTISQA